MLVTQVRKAGSTYILLSFLVTLTLTQKSDLTDLNWLSQNLNAHWIYSGEKQHFEWTSFFRKNVIFAIDYFPFRRENVNLTTTKRILYS